jgi:four helix bundle protein
MGTRGFKDLIVWQKAKELAVTTYKITSLNKAFEKDLGLRDQMRRSSVSIASNIAEGDERNTDKESIRFFYIAKGSLAELRTQIEIAYSIQYITSDVFETLDSDCQHLGKMIGRLIQVRQGKN